MTLTATTSTRYLARRDICTCGHEFRSNESWCPRCQESATPALARFDMSSLQLPAQRQVPSRSARVVPQSRSTLTTGVIAFVASSVIVLLTFVIAMMTTLT